MVSEKIRELRKKAKLSQEALAEKIGVSRQAVTKWETGAGVPDIDNLIAIAELFQVSMDELVGTKTIKNYNKSEFVYESVTEYDIDNQKDFDIIFMGARSVSLHTYDGEKVRITLGSNAIANLQKVFKTKIDDVKKKIDIDINRMSDISETEAKREVSIDVMLPSAYIGKIEVEGNTNHLTFSNIENDNIEYTGKVKTVLVENIKSHLEINTNEDAEVYIKNTEGALDVNQLSSTSKLFISPIHEFGLVTKGFLTKIICDKDVFNIKEIIDAPRLVIELNGMKSELSILPIEE